MRREEAEQEAAWRNAHDERRTRLEFYAFDASAGLADDAWEVTMRLRRERPAVATPTTSLSSTQTAEAPAPAAEPPSPAEGALWDETPEAQAGPPTAGWDPFAPEGAPEKAADDAVAVDAWPAAEQHAPDAPRARPPPRRGPRLGRRSREPVEEAEEEAPRPQRGLLERVTRLVGGGVVGIAILWVAAVIALAILVRSTSPTALGIFAAGLVVGLLCLGLGLVIRRT